MADKIAMLPCPFCGSKNVDPEGWASTVKKGPACDDCGGSTDTVERWNNAVTWKAIKRATAILDRTLERKYIRAR